MKINHVIIPFKKDKNIQTNVVKGVLWTQGVKTKYILILSCKNMAIR
jgi:hypothetical protein